jgi:hypothetical protein
MNKFYVYAVKDEGTDNVGKYIYINEENIEGFAENEFNPYVMDYSGVVVEADNPQHAHEIYMSFGQDGNIFWTDEPTCTMNRRRVYDARRRMLKAQQFRELQQALKQSEQTANRLAAHAFAKGISLDLIKINTRLCRLAELIHSMFKGQSECTVEQLYDRLRKQYIQILLGYEYEGPESSSPVIG